jgi:predicted ATP-dependent protease
MNNYYKFRISHFRLNEELKTIEQVNDAEDTKSVSHISNSVTYDSMLTVISRDGWEPITEEQYTTKRSEVLAVLSSM